MVSDPSLAIEVPGYIFQPLASLAQQEPADMVYVSYRDEARKWLNSGVPKSEVLGAEEVAVDLLFRPRTFSDPFNVATWACEFNKSFGDQQCWYQLAAVSFMSRLMKARHLYLLPLEFTNVKAIVANTSMFRDIREDTCSHATHRSSTVRVSSSIFRPSSFVSRVA